MSRVRARVEGTVQGVGFRPYVYRLAGELGVAGHVLNDSRGVVVEIEAPPETVDRFLTRMAAEAPPLAHVERVVAEAVEETGRLGFVIRESLDDGQARCRSHARRRHLPRLPGRAVRPRGPPLSLPVHELHQLRAPLHDRPRRALRQAEHDDGRLHDVRSRAGASTRIRATVASTRSPTRVRTAARAWRSSTPEARGRRLPAPATTYRPPRGRCWTARSSPSRASAASISLAAPTTSLRSRSCVRASTARTSRSP